VQLKDSQPLYLGNSNDLSLFHDATDCRIRYNHAVGSLKFQKNDNSNVLTLDGSGNATFTGTVTTAGVTIDGAYEQVSEAVSALDIDLSTGNYFTKTINANSTFTFSNPASSGTTSAFTLELTHTSGTVTWPSEVKWNGDSAPTLTAGKTHLFMFVTDDGGSRYRGAALVDYVN